MSSTARHRTSVVLATPERKSLLDSSPTRVNGNGNHSSARKRRPTLPRNSHSSNRSVKTGGVSILLFGVSIIFLASLYIVWMVSHSQAILRNTSTTTSKDTTMVTTTSSNMIQIQNVLGGVASNAAALRGGNGQVAHPKQQPQQQQQALQGNSLQHAALKKTAEKQEQHQQALDSKYIVFLGMGGGQGAGNIMNGLLAAHLFGVEFNRTVCLTHRLEDFSKAFMPTHEESIHKCQLLQQAGLPEPSAKNSIAIVNFAAPPNECLLQEIMLNDDVPVLYLEGNTYPRWPVVPNNLFFTYYAPRPTLLAMLPYNYTMESPKTVVHLRLQDGETDKRKGLDDASLKALGEYLSSFDKDRIVDTPYLVTNHVKWFDDFRTKFGWRHPHWHVVTHSVMSVDSKVWGTRDDNTTVVNPLLQNLTPKEVQNLQLWADWLALVSAKRVIHTHSDFSLSAIHFMNIDSKTIMGMKKKENTDNEFELDLIDESWRRDGETERLIDRTTTGPTSETIRLRLCNKPASTLRGMQGNKVRPRLYEY